MAMTRSEQLAQIQEKIDMCDISVKNIEQLEKERWNKFCQAGLLILIVGAIVWNREGWLWGIATILILDFIYYKSQSAQAVIINDEKNKLLDKLNRLIIKQSNLRGDLF